MSVQKKKRGRPSQGQGHLTSKIIVVTAKELMRDSGKVPSVRQLSGALGIDAMSIYHYFKNKSALLEAVTVSLMDDIYEPDPSGIWQEEVELLCKSYLGLLRENSGLLETMLSMSCAGPAQVFSQRLAGALAPLALGQEPFDNARDLLADYLHGVALAMKCNSEASLGDSISGPLKLVYAGLTNSSVSSR